MNIHIQLYRILAFPISFFLYFKNTKNICPLTILLSYCPFVFYFRIRTIWTTSFPHYSFIISITNIYANFPIINHSIFSYYFGITISPPLLHDSITSISILLLVIIPYYVILMLYLFHMFI